MMMEYFPKGCWEQNEPSQIPVVQDMGSARSGVRGVVALLVSVGLSVG